ncbi:MAG: FAD-dependent oxidoreductase [Myxococcota bacterium]
MRVAVIGAGVAGLACATELVERGVHVEIYERGDRLGHFGASTLAGGMLAPFCERESAEPEIIERAAGAIAWWAERVSDVTQRGTLVVAPPRDRVELERFAARTRGFRWVDEHAIARLEPDLAGRFRAGLHFESEAHLTPRHALSQLASRLVGKGAGLRFGVDAIAAPPCADAVIDCRGFDARAQLPELRAVRGEMVRVRCPELSLSRPVRLLHPRTPVYVVPHSDGSLFLGATMVESASMREVSVRAMLELLGAAYAVHPALAEAEILEAKAGVRPAFPSNLPQVRATENGLSVNGLYRHGFLLAPSVARHVAQIVLGGSTHAEPTHAAALGSHLDAESRHAH